MKLSGDLNQLKIASSDRIEEWNTLAWNQMENISFPSVKQEKWKYTSLKTLEELDLDFQLKNQDEDQSDDRLIRERVLSCTGDQFIRLVFVNGKFKQQWSHLGELKWGEEVSEVKQNISKSFDLLKKVQAVHSEMTYFEALNQALFSNGIFFHFKKNQVISTPIYFINVQVGKNNSKQMYFPFRVFFQMDQGSEAQIIEQYCGDQSAFVSPVTYGVLEDNSKLKHVQVQQENELSHFIGLTKVVQKKNSFYQSTVLSLGSSLSRHDFNVDLVEPGAEVQLNGFYLVDGKRHCDHHTQIRHLSPHCKSFQLYKGILNDSARAVFDGCIYIAPKAQKSESQQLNKNLLLSRFAEVNSKPNLEIFADDVKATHGSAIGQINEEEIFYLLSRGINRAQAVEMLSFGFVGEIFDYIENPDIKRRLQLMIVDHFKRFLKGGEDVV